MLQVDGQSIACTNSVAPSECFVDAQIANSPSLSSVTVTDASTLTLTGSGFSSLSGWTPSASFRGVVSDSGSILSDTEVTVTFDNGVPITDSAATVSLRFENSVNGNLMVAYQVTAVEIASNALSVSGSSSGLTCSFQGGCAYSVTANGLTSVLLPGEEAHENRIEVCGQRCEVDASASDASQATCIVPPIATSYSASNFEIVTADNVFTHTSSVTASAMDQVANLFDGDNLNDYVDSAASCFVEAQFLDSYVGVLDSIKFFINNLHDNTPFVGKLVLQGSNDGSAYDTLWTVDANIHEGWNSMEWEEGSKPAYNRYRFAGSASGACRMGEISAQGVIAIDDNNDSYNCPVNVIVQGNSVAANDVTVSAASTPELASISPRFGSVLGGESITFTGTGFSASATTTVTLDDIDCVVTSQTDTSVTCTTGSRADTLNAPSLRISIDGVGDVATKG